MYRNNNGTMARITIDDLNGVVTKELDFKEDKLSDEELVVRKKSLALLFTDEESINSILDFLEYRKDNTIKRIRYTYVKDNAKFELDEYILPEKSCVVAFEGDKLEVDEI